MSELCLGVAPSLDSTKGLEEGRVMLDQSLDFMTYLFPLHSFYLGFLEPVE